MLFHSSEFLIFFVAFLPVFALLKGPARLNFTALTSFVFYAWWFPPYLLLLIAFTLAAYFAALRIPRLSGAAFTCLIVAALLPLCFFKYTHFIWNNLAPWLPASADSLRIPDWRLPLGISFITFTVLAYWIDIRRGQYAPEKSLPRVALYLSFFPHLIAGPIMRPAELFPQFSHLKLNRKLVKAGVLLVAIGMIKKIVFADLLSPIVEQAYQAGAHPDLRLSALAFYAFPVQIYCDFSGYTDMALGLALILGVRLPLNFNRPYRALSMRDFWRRWHITLSRWLRDYLYIPLGGSRHGVPRMLLALLLTMLIGGLWHGASWTFVLWGAYHGIFLIAEHLAVRSGLGRWKLPDFIKRPLTFHVVAAGWVLFRAENLHSARELFAGLFRPGQAPALPSGQALTGLVLILIFWAAQRFDRVSFYCWMARRRRSAVVYAVSAAIILLCLALSVGNPNAFIYFDF